MSNKTTAELIAWNRQMALSLSLTNVDNAQEFIENHIENHKATANRLAEMEDENKKLRMLLEKSSSSVSALLSYLIDEGNEAGAIEQSKLQIEIVNFMQHKEPLPPPPASDTITE